MVGTFWQRILEGFSSPTPLPGAARSGDRTDAPSGFAEAHLSAEASATLRSFAAKHGFELRSIVAGAWAIVLSRYSGEEDVVFGILDPRAAASSEILPVRVRANGGRLSCPGLPRSRTRLPIKQQQPRGQFPIGVALLTVLPYSRAPSISMHLEYPASFPCCCTSLSLPS